MRPPPPPRAPPPPPNPSSLASWRMRRPAHPPGLAWSSLLPHVSVALLQMARRHRQMLPLPQQQVQLPLPQQQVQLPLAQQQVLLPLPPLGSSL